MSRFAGFTTALAGSFRLVRGEDTDPDPAGQVGAGSLRHGCRAIHPVRRHQCYARSPGLVRRAAVAPSVPSRWWCGGGGDALTAIRRWSTSRASRSRDGGRDRLAAARPRKPLTVCAHPIVASAAAELLDVGAGRERGGAKIRLLGAAGGPVLAARRWSSRSAGDPELGRSATISAARPYAARSSPAARSGHGVPAGRAVRRGHEVDPGGDGRARHGAEPAAAGRDSWATSSWASGIRPSWPST
jgi:hypothetical protein